MVPQAPTPCFHASSQRQVRPASTGTAAPILIHQWCAEALTQLLQADGRLQVVGRARDGREGVELAEALRPDVVLMDIVLPGDGRR